MAETFNDRLRELLATPGALTPEERKLAKITLFAETYGGDYSTCKESMKPLCESCKHRAEHPMLEDHKRLIYCSSFRCAKLKRWVCQNYELKQDNVSK